MQKTRGRQPQYPICRTPSGNLEVFQHTIGHFELTYNPDDDRLYVLDIISEETVATFQNNKHGWWNAIYFMKTH